MTLEQQIRASGPLRQGSKGDVVTAMQTALRAQGYRVTPDGDFGGETKRAIEQFQRERGLGLDGECGPETARALDAPMAVLPVRSDFNSAPVWFQWALHEVGVHELSKNSGPDVRRYIDDAHVGREGWPWCAEFINAALEVNGVPGSRSASSQSFLSHPNFVRLAGPALGAITVFGRTPRGQGLGHVTFYRGETPDRIYGLGGNQADSVSIEGFPRAGATMWFEAYCWPKGEPLPLIAAIPIRAGQPLTQIKVV